MTMSDEGAWQRARGVLLRHADHACSLQALDPGFHYWLAEGDRAVIGYVQQGRTRIVAGAPVGEAAALPAATRAFVAEAAAARHTVLWFLVEPTGRARLDPLAAAGGWLQVGAQPEWSPPDLVAEFERHRSLRMQLHRAANKGVQVGEWPIERARESVELMRCLVHWLRTRRAPPLRLLAGPTMLPDLRDRRVLVAERDGVPLAYLLLLPIPGRDAVLVEQIVRGVGFCNGTSESLVHRAACVAAAAGCRRLTLGCSPLSRHGIAAGHEPGPLLRLVRRLGHRCYDFDGVDRWKAKFAPVRWEPLWLGRAGGRLRLRDWLALARAEAGGALLAFGLGVLRRRLP